MQNKITHSLKLIEEAVAKYEKIAVACSFGKDSIVTLHLCMQVDPNMQVISVMTPYKFRETLEYKGVIEREWNLNIRTYRGKSLDRNQHLYECDPEQCCKHYKVEPMRRAVANLKLDAWISGLRGTEGHTRKFCDEIEIRDGLVKINPILNWTEADVWLYHSINHITPHPLYAQGYRSLGCQPCSLPYTETERGGRWQGTQKEAGECGIHSKSLVGRDTMPAVDVYGCVMRDKGKF